MSVWANRKRLALDARSRAQSLSWDKPGAVNMLPWIQRREAPGHRKSIRMSHHKILYCFVDPEKLGSLDKPPIGVESALLEVFGEERCRELKVRLHPLMKRWCLYQRVYFPKIGDNLWEVVSIFSEEPVPGQIPQDYIGDPFLEPFSKFVGEYRVPNKRDFECIEPTDRKRYTADAICEYFTKPELAEEKESERQMADFTDDFLSYYFNQAVDEANQNAGSGQHMRSTDTVIPHENPERWLIEEREGYRVKVRRGTRLEQELKEGALQAAEAENTKEDLVKWTKLKELREKSAVLAMTTK